MGVPGPGLLKPIKAGSVRWRRRFRGVAGPAAQVTGWRRRAAEGLYAGGGAQTPRTQDTRGPWARRRAGEAVNAAKADQLGAAITTTPRTHAPRDGCHAGEPPRPAAPPTPGSWAPPSRPPRRRGEATTPRTHAPRDVCHAVVGDADKAPGSRAGGVPRSSPARQTSRATTRPFAKCGAEPVGCVRRIGQVRATARVDGVEPSRSVARRLSAGPEACLNQPTTAIRQPAAERQRRPTANRQRSGG
jgi:hypothetical protein